MAHQDRAAEQRASHRRVPPARRSVPLSRERDGAPRLPYRDTYRDTYRDAPTCGVGDRAAAPERGREPVAVVVEAAVEDPAELCVGGVGAAHVKEVVVISVASVVSVQTAAPAAAAAAGGGVVVAVVARPRGLLARKAVTR